MYDVTLKCIYFVNVFFFFINLSKSYVFMLRFCKLKNCVINFALFQPHQIVNIFYLPSDVDTEETKLEI